MKPLRGASRISRPNAGLFHQAVKPRPFKAAASDGLFRSRNRHALDIRMRVSQHAGRKKSYESCKGIPASGHGVPGGQRRRRPIARQDPCRHNLRFLGLDNPGRPRRPSTGSTTVTGTVALTVQ